MSMRKTTYSGTNSATTSLLSSKTVCFRRPTHTNRDSTATYSHSTETESPATTTTTDVATRLLSQMTREPHRHEGVRCMGNVIASTWSTVTTHQFFGRQGCFLDSTVGRIHSRSRFYAPQLSRWISRARMALADLSKKITSLS